MKSREWVVFDTNIWIFGLRESVEFPACSILLRNLPKLFVKIPRQIILELQDNLTNDELSDFYRLLNQNPENYERRWEKAKGKLLNKYMRLGCKLGDAVISSHMEELNIKTLVSENRDFLLEAEGLPFRVLNSEAAVKELLYKMDR